MQRFLADKCSDIFEKRREERLKDDEIKRERFEENLLRRRKAHEEILQAEAEKRAEAEAKERYEKSFRGRCRACMRRLSGEKSRKDDPSSDDQPEEEQDQNGDEVDKEVD